MRLLVLCRFAVSRCAVPNWKTNSVLRKQGLCSTKCWTEFGVVFFSCTSFRKFPKVSKTPEILYWRNPNNRTGNNRIPGGSDVIPGWVLATFVGPRARQRHASGSIRAPWTSCTVSWPSGPPNRTTTTTYRYLLVVGGHNTPPNWISVKNEHRPQLKRPGYHARAAHDCVQVHRRVLAAPPGPLHPDLRQHSRGDAWINSIHDRQDHTTRPAHLACWRSDECGGMQMLKSTRGHQRRLRGRTTHNILGDDTRRRRTDARRKALPSKVVHRGIAWNVFFLMNFGGIQLQNGTQHSTTKLIALLVAHNFIRDWAWFELNTVWNLTLCNVMCAVPFLVVWGVDVVCPSVEPRRLVCLRASRQREGCGSQICCIEVSVWQSFCASASKLNPKRRPQEKKSTPIIQKKYTYKFWESDLEICGAFFVDKSLFKFSSEKKYTY